MIELRFFDRQAARDLPASVVGELDTIELLSRVRRIPDGAPLFMDGFRPVPFWFDYGLWLSGAQREPTLRQYSYLVAKFARYLDDKQLRIPDVSEADIVEYRESRRAAGGLSDVSWKLDGTILRSVFEYAIYKGLVPRLPWFDYGRRNAVRQPTVSAPNVRGLTEAEWAQFKSIGLMGRDLKGRPDSSFVGLWAMRNIVGAQIALATGLRVQEFSTLLLPEVLAPTNERGGLYLTVQAVAKGKRRRTVYVPSGAVQRMRAFIRTDRAALLAHLGGATHTKREGMFLIEAWQPGILTLEGTIDGGPHSTRVETMSPALRARTFIRSEDGYQPLALFVNSWGRMASKSTWHRVFAAASARVAAHPSSLSMARDVHPHTLRHTFARRYLAYLHRAALEHAGDSEWGEIDPLVTVQRALGHSSLETTAKYIAGDTVSSQVEELFHLETDESADFAELIERFKDRKTI